MIGQLINFSTKLSFSAKFHETTVHLEESRENSNQNSMFSFYNYLNC